MSNDFGIRLDPQKNTREQIEEVVEAMKNRPAVRKIVSQMDKLIPDVVQVMLHDRDQNMVDQLWSLKEKKVVAVVGLGIFKHLLKLEAFLNDLHFKQLTWTGSKKGGKTNELCFNRKMCPKRTIQIKAQRRPK